MPVSMDLRENGRVVFIVLTDPWNTGDVKSLLRQITVYLRDTCPQAHMLVDLTHARVIPPDVLQQIFEDLRSFKPERGEVILVGATRGMQLLGELVFRLFHLGSIRFYDSQAAAWTFLGEIIEGEDNLRIRSQEPASAPKERT
jgi:hypothetical protein